MMVSIALCYVVLRVFSRQCVPVPVVAERSSDVWSVELLSALFHVDDLRHEA